MRPTSLDKRRFDGLRSSTQYRGFRISLLDVACFRMKGNYRFRSYVETSKLKREIDAHSLNPPPTAELPMLPRPKSIVLRSVPMDSVASSGVSNSSFNLTFDLYPEDSSNFVGLLSWPNSSSSPSPYFNSTNDCSNTTTESPSNPFHMPWWQEVLWFFLFGGMVLVATGGNLIVIWIVLTEKRMRTVTNIFLVNLSVADTMVCTLNVIFSIIYMVSGHWPFGRFYCKISQFVAMLSISASVFTLMTISIDRYLAIMHPWRRRLGRKATLFIVVCIWAVSSGVAAPNFIVYTTEVLFECNSFRVICYSRWPDGDQADSRLEYFHSIVVIVLTYVVPMLSMGFTYTRMGVMLWGSRAIGEPTPRLRDALRSKRKVVKMMIVVVLIFGVCWLPFHMYFVLYNQIPEINSYKYIQEVYLALYWLAMSNSMYNPMIYCWLNSRFRNGFKRVLAPWCPCIPSLATPSGPVRNNTTQSNVFASIGPPGAADRLHCDTSLELTSRQTSLTYVDDESLLPLR